MNFTILRFDTIDSTNAEAARQARLGAEEGTCVAANEQTSGRGRYGRRWESAKGTGLYFSIILRPRIDNQYLPLITLMTGVAVHDTLVEIGIKPDIKWVNDVLVNERKICGILAETVDTNLGLAIVDGVGINLKSTAFPIEIAETATSIENETGTIFLPNEVSEVLTRYFNYFYDIFSGNDGPAEIIQHWRRRSTYFSGKAVLVTLAEGAIEGTTDGLEENGALRVKTSDGTVKVVQAGDVERIRRHTH